MTQLLKHYEATLDVLAVDRPAATARTRAWLDHALAGLRDAPEGEPLWRSSGLTGDGYPVEFTFTTADDDIRCTVEPWPHAPAAQRVAQAVALATEPGSDHHGALTAELAGFQPPGSTLSFGAWVGGRFGADPANDRSKIYVEIAPEVQLSDAPAFGDLCVEPRIEAVEPATGRRERYYRGRGLQPHHLAQLLDRVGMRERFGDLRDSIESAYGRPLDGALPGGSAGWSLAEAPGRPPVMTVFMFARGLWGRDSRIIAQVQQFCSRFGLELTGHAAAVRSLPPSRGACTWHGMVGLMVAPGQPVHLALGLRPAKASQGRLGSTA
jgi:hypothetical protein